MDICQQRNTFNRYIQVSRETIISLKKYEKILIEANKSVNLIGNSTIKNIWYRHFMDSAQVIDFIDKNDKSVADLGSGAGFPGLVLAIIAKDRKMNFKTSLIEKSPKKAKFLKHVVDQLKLNVSIKNVNILDDKKKYFSDIIVARAFKPLKIIFQLIHKKIENWNKIIIFLGKSGKEELLQASKIWDIEYKQRMSITTNDSFIIEIKKLKKK
jgi:16S rRNA (guanine527-N7)-methyltransferase